MTGQQLKALRLAAQLTQKEAAGLLKISFAQYKRYECGRNRIPALVQSRISKVFANPVAVPKRRNGRNFPRPSRGPEKKDEYPLT